MIKDSNLIQFIGGMNDVSANVLKVVIEGARSLKSHLIISFRKNKMIREVPINYKHKFQ